MCKGGSFENQHGQPVIRVGKLWRFPVMNTVFRRQCGNQVPVNAGDSPFDQLVDCSLILRLSCVQRHEWIGDIVGQDALAIHVAPPVLCPQAMRQPTVPEFGSRDGSTPVVVGDMQHVIAIVSKALVGRLRTIEVQFDF